MKHKKHDVCLMFLSVPPPLKLLANIFISHRYIYLVTCRLQSWSLRGLHIIGLKRKNNTTKKLRPHSKKKIVLASEYYFTCVIVFLFVILLRFITWKLLTSSLEQALAPHDYAGNFYLIWFVNCKTIKINLCNAVNFP